MLRIGYLTLHNPYDRNSFSGTSYYMFDALANRSDVELKLLGENYHLRPNFSVQLLRKLKYKAKKNSGLRKLLEKMELNACIKSIIRDLKSHQLDFLIAPVSTSLIAAVGDHEKCPPILFTTDATPEFIANVYKWEVSDEAFAMEETAMRLSTHIAYSSDFMAERARSEYKGILDGTDKISVLPFGLNMDSVPPTGSEKDVDTALELVFVGKDWIRKGGATALVAQQALLKKGIDARLLVIGCDPEEAKGKKGVEVIPFLNKNVPEQQQKYFDILTRAHFLVLPTLADCTPMVIAEANSFGAPAIVSNVGGIPTLVKENENGALLDESASGEAYAEKIADIFTNKTAYTQLSKLSRKAYEDRLNWDAWANKVYQIGNTLK